ncbi:hypothetical protein Trydic_g4440 [Trypoxylus dichotomus]
MVTLSQQFSLFHKSLGSVFEGGGYIKEASMASTGDISAYIAPTEVARLARSSLSVTSRKLKFIQDNCSTMAWTDFQKRSLQHLLGRLDAVTV